MAGGRERRGKEKGMCEYMEGGNEQCRSTGKRDRRKGVEKVVEKKESVFAENCGAGPDVAYRPTYQSCVPGSLPLPALRMP